MPRFTELELQALRACVGERNITKAALNLGLSVKLYKDIFEPAVAKAAKFINWEAAHFLHLLNFKGKRGIVEYFLRVWQEQMVTMDDPMF